MNPVIYKTVQVEKYHPMANQLFIQTFQRTLLLNAIQMKTLKYFIKMKYLMSFD